MYRLASGKWSRGCVTRCSYQIKDISKKRSCRRLVITEYADCHSIKFADIPDSKIDKKTDIISVEMDLPNGKETEIELFVGRKKDGSSKIVELQLDKELTDEEVGDIADLYWYLFPQTREGKKNIACTLLCSSKKCLMCW